MGTIYDNVRVGAPSTDHLAVKTAFESTYSALGLSCDDVGGLWDTAGDFAGMEPCVNVSAQSTSADEDSSSADTNGSMSMSMPAKSTTAEENPSKSTSVDEITGWTSGHGSIPSNSYDGSKSSKTSYSSKSCKSSKSKFMKESHDDSSCDGKSGKTVHSPDAKATKVSTSKSSKGSKRLFPTSHKIHWGSSHST